MSQRMICLAEQISLPSVHAVALRHTDVHGLFTHKTLRQVISPLAKYSQTLQYLSSLNECSSPKLQTRALRNAWRAGGTTAQTMR